MSSHPRAPTRSRAIFCTPLGFCHSRIQVSQACPAMDFESHILVCSRVGSGPSPSSWTIPGSSTSILSLSSGSGPSSSPELKAGSMADRYAKFALMALQRGVRASLPLDLAAPVGRQACCFLQVWSCLTLPIFPQICSTSLWTG